MITVLTKPFVAQWAKDLGLELPPDAVDILSRRAAIKRAARSAVAVGAGETGGGSAIGVTDLSFQPDARDGTQVTIDVHGRPPTGRRGQYEHEHGHGLAAVGSDPGGTTDGSDSDIASQRRPSDASDSNFHPQGHPRGHPSRDRSRSANRPGMELPPTTTL